MAEATRLYPEDDPHRAYCLIGYSGLRWRLYWDRNFGCDHFILKDAARGETKPWSTVQQGAEGTQVALPPPEGAWVPLEPEELAAAQEVVLSQPDGLAHPYYRQREGVR